jgi:6,7-dimethyl-8-ribityllumazine synthase
MKGAVPGDRVVRAAAATLFAPLRVLVVEARYYAEISDELAAGALEALAEARAEIARATVPGAFEIPAAIALAADSGGFDAYVALGCVVRGETSHYDYVCGESARGLMDLAVGRRLAIGYGILTVETLDQAWARARRTEGAKGAAAADAALSMALLARRMRGAR